MRGRGKRERERGGVRGRGKRERERGRWRREGEGVGSDEMSPCCMDGIAILKKEHIGIAMANIRHGSG